MLQLHGDEGPAFCAEAARRTGARVIKAAQVAGPGDVRDLERFHVDFHLLDARAKAPERQGLRGRHRRDVRLGAASRARRSKVPLILSGGLTRGQRRRGDRRGASLRGRHRERHRVRARAQGPRAAARVLRRRRAFGAAGAGDAAPTASRRRRRGGRERGRERGAPAPPSSTASAPTAASSCPRR